ncbi:hypothetical protein A9Q84_18915 [Halobacteriovorax marinus]|uniref:Short-chain dehydrogenase n=1 Tax=Halobacteriovorax marinus TaxID=97084 RepID=A0A1Y5F287_9BACT|nr:hypothetical protein A9Q84_18915 [Halobacteriovorax marinus]
MNAIQTKNEEWALVTGSSSGIGLAFAEELCKQKRNVILVARNKELLIKESKRLEDHYKVKVRIIVADLTEKSGLERIFEQTKDLVISLLINNAGKEDSGNFLDIDIEDMNKSLSLNCQAPLSLSHHFGNLMKKSGEGEILFVSSIVAFQGIPLIANYAATKSYVLILAEGLASEFKPFNINVSIVAPGFTKTNLSPDISFSGVPIKPALASDVARTSLDARRMKLLFIPGFINKLLFYSGKYIQTRKANTASFGKVFKKVLHKKMESV